MRPPGAASPSAKSIQEDEIPLALMVGRMKKLVRILPLSRKLWTQARWILTQILSFRDFFLLFFFLGGGRPPSGEC